MASTLPITSISVILVWQKGRSLLFSRSSDGKQLSWPYENVKYRYVEAAVQSGTSNAPDSLCDTKGETQARDFSRFCVSNETVDNFLCKY